MSLSVCKEFTFHAAHRLIGHEGLCQFFHGHSYKVAVHARNKTLIPAESLDQVGRIVDFGDLKRHVGHFIAEHWDHAMILSENDPLLQHPDLEKMFPRRYVLPVNPTAEVMSLHLLNWCLDRFSATAYEVWRIEVWETETSKAVATVEN